MQDWPSGAHIVLETVCDNVPLIAMGYKYNKRKVICFVATKGAGHTEAGVSYEAKWKDSNGNTCCRNVPRPELASKYFLESNRIDMFNQARQAELKLEKHWVSEDGYFRCITTLFGICVTDAWKGYQYHLPNKHRHKGIEILHFAKLLTKDLLENGFCRRIDDDTTSLVIQQDTPRNTNQGLTTGFSLSLLESSSSEGAVSISQVSELTEPAMMESSLSAEVQKQLKEYAIQQVHTLQLCDEHVFHSVGKGSKMRTGIRKRRGKCIVCKNNTRHYCQGCQPANKRVKQWCCSNDVERRCHQKHIEAIKRNNNSNNSSNQK